MTNTTEKNIPTTYDWIKHLPSALIQTDAIPLLGFPPAFPWEAFSLKLGDLLSLKGLKIQPDSPIDWRPGDELLKGFGNNPLPLYISLVPSLPPLCFIIAPEDLNSLFSVILAIDDKAVQELDADFREGFFRFLGLETLNALLLVDFDKTFAPHLLEDKNLPNETSLCQDIAITVKDRTIHARLILSPSFRKGWQERYTPRSLDIPKPLLQYINVEVNFEIGRTSMTLSEWANVKPGDFIVLDSCSLKPSGEGRIILSLNGAPIFRGKLKDGNIKVLENPLYLEEEMSMNNASKDNEEEHTFEDEMDESLDFDEELSDENAENAENVESAQEPGQNEELDEFDEDEEFDEDLSDEEEDVIPPAVAPKQAPQPQAQPTPIPQAPVAAAPTTTTTAPPTEKKPISPENIPLSVVVEIGRVQMSLQKLIELQPGNLLELNVKPENGVDLVVNGKRIAKGELLLIGEALGVRILDIG